jgi:hypothetical protein
MAPHSPGAARWPVDRRCDVGGMGRVGRLGPVAALMKPAFGFGSPTFRKLKYVQARARSAHSDRSGVCQRRFAWRRAGGTHSTDRPGRRLRQQRPAPLRGRAARRIHRLLSAHHPDRPPSQDRHLSDRPFFGVMGVAPLLAMVRISSMPPGVHTGNLDNKGLIAGTTLYLPVYAAGALF